MKSSRTLIGSITIAAVIGLLVVSVPMAEGSNILAVFTSPMISHYLTSVNLLKELARSGHMVTVITLLSAGNDFPEGYVEKIIPFDKKNHDGEW